MALVNIISVPVEFEASHGTCYVKIIPLDLTIPNVILKVVYLLFFCFLWLVLLFFTVNNQTIHLILIFQTKCCAPFLPFPSLLWYCSILQLVFFFFDIFQTSDEILLMIQVLNRIGLDCPDLETICLKDQTLTTESQFLKFEIIFPAKYVILKFSGILPIISCQLVLLDVEKIIGWAISFHSMHSSEASMKDSKPLISAERLFSSFLVISILEVLKNGIMKCNQAIWPLILIFNTTFSFNWCSIKYGLDMLQAIQNENKSLKKSLKVV